MVGILAVLPLLFAGSTLGSAQEEKSTGKKGWLGVSIADMSAERAKDMKVKTELGALVQNVADESPAEGAGIKEDDIIVEFAGKKIEDASDLRRAVSASTPGTKATVIVLRNDQRKTFQVTIGTSPEEELAVVRIPRAPRPPVIVRPRAGHFYGLSSSSSFGMSFMDLNKQLGAYFGAPNNKGVLVEEVEKDEAADKAGFKAGDVIVKVGDDTIEDTRDIWDAMEDYKKGEKIPVEVLRRGSRMSLSLEAEGETGTWHMHGWHSPNFDFDFKWDRDVDVLMDLKNKQEFETQEFESSMKNFGKEMKDLQRQLRDELKEMKVKVERRVREGKSI
jgi:serine protease Do